MKNRHLVSQVLFCLIPFSLCFSHRLNSFIILCYGLFVLIQPQLGKRIRLGLRQKWIRLFLLLYFLCLLSLFWTADLESGLFILEKKAALIVLPVIMALDNHLDKKVIYQSFFSFLMGTCLALFFALIVAIRKYLFTGDHTVLFYHKLGLPLDQFSAIYFSFYLLVSLILLDSLKEKESFNFLDRLPLQWGLKFFLLLGILLFSSKLFIVLTLLYLLIRNIKSGSSASRYSWIIAFSLLIGGVFLLNFTKNRFVEIWHSNFGVVNQDQYQWNTRFTGLTLRVVFLKFGWEILEKEAAFLKGVGIGDGQNEMNATIIRHNVYHGNPDYGDTGYLGYNFHNQYMELWVEIGLIGLIIWLLILREAFSLGLKLGWQNPLLFFVIILAVFALFESYLERQRGVVFITFFLSAIYTTQRK